MNNKENTKESAKMRYIENRLSEWADWSRKIDDNGSRRSSTFNVLTRNHAPTLLAFHKAAEEIEQLLQEMTSHHQEMSDALRMHYLTQDISPQKTSSFSLSHPLTMAHQWLAKRLNASLIVNPWSII